MAASPLLYIRYYVRTTYYYYLHLHIKRTLDIILTTHCCYLANAAAASVVTSPMMMISIKPVSVIK